MKKAFLSLVIMSTWVAGVLPAAPPMQHPLNAVVHAIDLAQGILTVEPTKKNSPTEFVVIAQRTRLFCDRQPAKLADLTVGQAVHLYYTREAGREVATEVSWKRSPAAPPSKANNPPP